MLLSRQLARAAPRLQRALSSASKDPPHQASGMSTRHAGGVPDFIHDWGPTPFRRVGYGLAIASASAFPLSFFDQGVSILAPIALTTLTAGYWAIGLSDLSQRHQALRRNFPVLIHVRYLLESIRPEIQQYLIESDEAAVPYSREMRSIIYQRSKKLPDTRALGTKRNVYAEGHEWASHSMFPVDHTTIATRVTIGGPDCSAPYSASLLNISAMSYGALSGNAVSALNLGAKEAGCYHNTGEGGISRYHLLGADVVWNVGTGYFACGESLPDGSRRFNAEQFASNATRDEVKMVEIKLSQGAKPSHGGILPAEKITPNIADARGLGPPPWVDCNSPPRHTAFSSPIGLMGFIAALRELSGGKPVGIKLCVGQPAELAALCHAMLETGVTPDFITVDGAEGGTGAAPLEFQNSLGMPLAEGLMLTDSLLHGAALRDRVKLIGSGKVYSGFSLVRTLAHGADLVNAARTFMFSLGCIQALKCNSNSCPTGITTHNPDLESGLDVPSKADRVKNLHAATVHAAAEIIGALGCTSSAEVHPRHLYRRDSGIHVRSFAELHELHFPRLSNAGVLVDAPESVPKRLRGWWEEGGRLNATLREPYQCG